MFRGFSLFVEEEEDKDHAPDAYLSTAKKQMGIPKKLWAGMPILVSNTRIGKRMITDPTMFYVTDFDDTSVTLVNSPKPGSLDDTSDGEPAEDPDDEIDLDKGTVHGHIEITISRDDFAKLQEPQIPPGMDASSMGGGMGGMGGGF